MSLDLPKDVEAVLLSFLERVEGGIMQPLSGAEYLAIRETLEKAQSGQFGSFAGPLLERFASPLARRMAAANPKDVSAMLRLFEKRLMPSPQEMAVEQEDSLSYEDLLYLVAKGIFSPPELAVLVDILRRYDELESKCNPDLGRLRVHSVLLHEIQRRLGSSR